MAVKTKIAIFFLVFFVNFGNIWAASPTVKTLLEESRKQKTIGDQISYINKEIPKITDLSEKRASYDLLASLQELASFYDDAKKNYALAAGITGSKVEGWRSKTNEQLVIDAVRCALCAGDYETADKYLASTVRNSKDDDILCYVKLYSQWSALCRAENSTDVKEPVELLKAYLNVASMKKLHPVIILTLWYVTGDNSYSEKLQTEYKNSIESSIVKGDTSLLPVPFWYFVPKTGVAEQGTGTYTQTATNSSSEATVQPKAKFSKWQLGLFKSEENAKALCDEVKAKGFDAFITSEKRASGTTYFIVFVKEDNSGTIDDRIRSAGYECYPVE